MPELPLIILWDAIMYALHWLEFRRPIFVDDRILDMFIMHMLNAAARRVARFLYPKLKRRCPRTPHNSL